MTPEEIQKRKKYVDMIFTKMIDGEKPTKPEKELLKKELERLYGSEKK